MVIGIGVLEGYIASRDRGHERLIIKSQVKKKLKEFKSLRAF